MHFQLHSGRESVSPSSTRNIRRAKLSLPEGFRFHILFLLGVFTLVSCGKDGPTRSTGPAKVVVTPNTITLTAIGQSVQLDAQVHDEAGADIGRTGDVTWSSRNPSVASVSSGGLVTAQNNGTADITATVGQKQGKSTVTVSQSVRTVTIEPSSITLTKAGETVGLKASVMDENGRIIEDAVVKWAISDESVATVSDDGTVTAVRSGSVVVTATSGEVSASVNVTVTIVVSDRTSLIDFYHALNGPSWDNGENWLSEEPLNEWHGVTTDANGRVIRLALRSNNLSGRLPENIINLALLRVLDLADNQVSGAIPVELSQLGELRILDWSSNGISGSIPNELDLLSNLEVLNLGNNNLSESIPSVLGQMASLERLDLGGQSPDRWNSGGTGATQQSCAS